MNFELYLFDIDGTLFEFDTGAALPGVLRWFETRDPQTPIGFVTNQGGVGLRHWMTRDGFGEPDKYPTEAEAVDRVTNLVNGLPRVDVKPGAGLWFSFAYQSHKSGKWSPTPDERVNDPSWRINWRKPLPGMGIAATHYFKVTPARVLYIGDDITDAQFANACGFNFQFRDGLFNIFGGV